MITRADVQEAHRHSREHRVAMARLFLRVDESKATDGDLEIAQRVIDAAMGDGEELDRALASRTVNSLFQRRVLVIGGGP